MEILFGEKTQGRKKKLKILPTNEFNFEFFYRLKQITQC